MTRRHPIEVELGSTTEFPSVTTRAPDRGLDVVCLVAFHPDAARIGEEFILAESDTWKFQVNRFEPEFCEPGAASGAPLATGSVSRDPLTIACEGEQIQFTWNGRAPVEVDGLTLVGTRTVPASLLRRGVVIFLCQSVVLILHGRADAAKVEPPIGFLGSSEGMRDVRAEIRRVADLNVPVLVRGETGVGKELVARALHALGGRPGAFVAVNMAAVPETTAAAELFGHVRGAFTDAKADSRGYFQTAEGGTLLLDEIGECSTELQVKLLRALETGEILKVGSSTPLKLSVRVIAATDADLDRAMQEGRFKAPLFHRLGQYHITIPPLRERRADVVALFYAFMHEALEKTGQQERVRAKTPWFPPTLMVQVLLSSWAGNVRQLKTFASSLAIANRGLPEYRMSTSLLTHLDADLITPPPLPPPPTQRTAPRPAESAPVDSGSQTTPGVLSEEAVIEALKANRWEVRATARALGVAANTLYQIIDRSPNLKRAADLSFATVSAALATAGGDQALAADALQLSLRALRQRMRELDIPY